MPNILKKINTARKVYKLAKNPAVQAAAIGAALGTPTAVGALAYQSGKKSGAENMANAMAREFINRNAIENQEIARTYFYKGLNYGKQMKRKSGINKKAILDQIRHQGWKNEMEKIAKNPLLRKLIKQKYLKRIPKYLKTLEKNDLVVPIGAGMAGFAIGKSMSD